MLHLKNKKVTPLQEKETKPIYCDDIQNKAKRQNVLQKKRTIMKTTLFKISFDLNLRKT